jgi:drug/metabolite transporter (DMT)-like permease
MAVMPDARRAWSWRLAPVAAAYAGTVVMFVVATKLTTAANAIFLQSTAPLYILLLGPFLLGERVRRSDITYAVVLAAGMVFLFLDAERALASAPNQPRGNAIAAASGIAWALTIMGLRWLGRTREGSTTITTVVAGNILACLVALPAAFPIARFSRFDLAVILYLGTVQIGLAYAFLSRAIRHLPAFEATTLLLIEPVMNPLWAWIVEGEKPGPFTLAGGGIILSATLAHSWRTSSRRP